MNPSTRYDLAVTERNHSTRIAAEVDRTKTFLADTFSPLFQHATGMAHNCATVARRGRANGGRHALLETSGIENRVVMRSPLFR